LAVARDSSHNIYAVGYQNNTGIYTYHGTASISGGFTGLNSVIVKFNSTGDALWARSVTGSGNLSQFNSVGVDNAGNIYAAGVQNGLGTFSYGGQTAAGTSSGSNAVLVKYDTSGNVLWAVTTSAGGTASQFYGVAARPHSAVLAAGGSQNGMGNYTYSGQSITGVHTSTNVTAVRYQ